MLYKVKRHIKTCIIREIHENQQKSDQIANAQKVGPHWKKFILQKCLTFVSCLGTYRIQNYFPKNSIFNPLYQLKVCLVKQYNLAKFQTNHQLISKRCLCKLYFQMRQHLNKSKIHRQTNRQTHRHLALNAFVCLCMTLYDYVCLCMTMYDYV